MTSLCPVRLLISLALLSLVTGFTPQSAATIRQRRRVFIADHQRHFVAENEKTMLAASKASRPTQTRRDSIQKLITRPVAALAATWITNNPWFTTKASASEAQSTPLLPETSAVLDPTVLTLIKGAKTIYIVGTAHISAVSADLAGRLVRETTPDAVFVELDAARLSRAFKGGIPPPGVSVAIHDDAGNLRVGVTQKPTITQRLAIKLVNALTNPTMYRKLEMAGISVGEEFVNAVKAGIDNNALIILGDQRMDITYQRLGKAMSQIDRKTLEELDSKLNEVVKAQVPEIEEWEKEGKRIRPKQVREFVESMKTVDTTSKMMEVFKKEIPAVWKAMVGERDAVMARNLNALPSQLETVVAVMGLGHLNGVKRHLESKGWKVLSLQ